MRRRDECRSHAFYGGDAEFLDDCLTLRAQGKHLPQLRDEGRDQLMIETHHHDDAVTRPPGIFLLCPADIFGAVFIFAGW